MYPRSVWLMSIQAGRKSRRPPWGISIRISRQANHARASRAIAGRPCANSPRLRGCAGKTHGRTALPVRADADPSMLCRTKHQTKQERHAGARSRIARQCTKAHACVDTDQAMTATFRHSAYRKHSHNGQWKVMFFSRFQCDKAKNEAVKAINKKTQSRAASWQGSPTPLAYANVRAGFGFVPASATRSSQALQLHQC